MIFNMDKPTVCMTIYHYSQRMLNWKKRRTSHRICFEAKKKREKKANFNFYIHTSQKDHWHFSLILLLYICLRFHVAVVPSLRNCTVYALRKEENNKHTTDCLTYSFVGCCYTYFFSFLDAVFFLVLFDKIKQKQERHSAQQQRIYR